MGAAPAAARCACTYENLGDACRASISRHVDWAILKSDREQCSRVDWEIDGHPRVTIVTDGIEQEELLNVGKTAELKVRDCRVCKDSGPVGGGPLEGSNPFSGNTPASSAVPIPRVATGNLSPFPSYQGYDAQQRRSEYNAAQTMPAMATGSNCPGTLAHLAPKLPAYGDADLQKLRQAILGTDVRQSLQTAKAMGYSPQAAVKAAMVQARQSEAGEVAARACIQKTAVNPEERLAALRAGGGSFRTDSMLQTCEKYYVLSYYNWIANTAAASAMACLAGKS